MLDLSFKTIEIEGGVIGSIIQWYKPKGDLSIDEIASAACTYILGALKRGDLLE